MYGNTEEWNGSAWTELNDLNTARGHGSGAIQGTAEAALCVGGVYPPTTHATIVEEWSEPSYTIKTVTVS